METLLPFEDSTPILNDAAALQARMERDGFFYFKGLLARATVLDLRRQILGVCQKYGWLSPTADLMDAIIDPVAANAMEPFCGVGVTQAAYREVYKLEAFHRLAQHPAVLGLMARLCGETVLPHPRNIARLMFPTKANAPTPPHQDYIHIQGTKAVYTCWIPLGDTTETLGGLQVLGGTHSVGLLPVRKSEGAGGLQVVLDGLNQVWSHGDFTAGDVLVFHSHTVHRSVPNQFPDRLRLSVDYRYQPVSLPIEKGSLQPHCAVAEWADIYAGWTDTSLQYYWEQYALEFQEYDRSLFVTEPSGPMMDGSQMGGGQMGGSQMGGSQMDGGQMDGGQMGGGMGKN